MISDLDPDSLDPRQELAPTDVCCCDDLDKHCSIEAVSWKVGPHMGRPGQRPAGAFFNRRTDSSAKSCSVDVLSLADILCTLSYSLYSWRLSIYIYAKHATCQVTPTALSDRCSVLPDPQCQVCEMSSTHESLAVPLGWTIT